MDPRLLFYLMLMIVTTDMQISPLQAKVKNRVFVKLDMRYADYFQNIHNNLEEP